MTKTKRTLSPSAKAETEILRQLLDPKVFGDFKLRAREWSILKKLRQKYEPIDFWKRVRPAIPLDTLAYFYGYGAEALHKEWDEYITFLFIQTSEQAEELERNIAKLERLLEKPLDTKAKTTTIEHKPNALEWADT